MGELIFTEWAYTLSTKKKKKKEKKKKNGRIESFMEQLLCYPKMS